MDRKMLNDLDTDSKIPMLESQMESCGKITYKWPSCKIEETDECGLDTEKIRKYLNEIEEVFCDWDTPYKYVQAFGDITNLCRTLLRHHEKKEKGCNKRRKNKD